MSVTQPVVLEHQVRRGGIALAQCRQPAALDANEQMR
jgi:hypothetical protein